jgi:hypothetical protein
MNTMPLHFYDPDIEDVNILYTSGYIFDGFSFSENQCNSMNNFSSVLRDFHSGTISWWGCGYPEQSYWYDTGDGICRDVAFGINMGTKRRKPLFGKLTMTNSYHTMMTSNFLVFSRRNAHKLVFKHVDSATSQE